MESSELYKIAYDVHYKEKNLEIAYALYNKILTDFPNSQEASYAKTQISNIEVILPNIKTDNEKFNIESFKIFQAERIETVKEKIAKKANAETAWKKVIINAGFNFEGYKIVEYKDFISYETAIGMGLFKNIASSFSNITGNESESLRNKLQEAREVVIEGIRRKAHKEGCNAIIGIDVDYSMFYNTMIAVVVSGTGVVIEKIQ